MAKSVKDFRGLNYTVKVPFPKPVAVPQDRMTTPGSAPDNGRLREAFTVTKSEILIQKKKSDDHIDDDSDEDDDKPKKKEKADEGYLPPNVGSNNYAQNLPAPVGKKVKTDKRLEVSLKDANSNAGYAVREHVIMSVDDLLPIFEAYIAGSSRDRMLSRQADISARESHKHLLAKKASRIAWDASSESGGTDVGKLEAAIKHHHEAFKLHSYLNNHDKANAHSDEANALHRRVQKLKGVSESVNGEDNNEIKKVRGSNVNPRTGNGSKVRSKYLGKLRGTTKTGSKADIIIVQPVMNGPDRNWNKTTPSGDIKVKKRSR